MTGEMVVTGETVVGDETGMMDVTINDGANSIRSSILYTASWITSCL